MVVNNYQTILIIELNDQMCYSEHHLMVPEHFYCWVAGSFTATRNDIVDDIVTCGMAFSSFWYVMKVYIKMNKLHVCTIP